MDAPVKLQGGGILRVSRGPEKAVQYKETGQYVESIAESLKDERAEEAASASILTPASTPVKKPVVSAGSAIIAAVAVPVSAKLASGSGSGSTSASVLPTPPTSQQPPAIKTDPSGPEKQEPVEPNQQQQQQKQQRPQHRREDQQQKQRQQQGSSTLVKSASAAESSVSGPTDPESPTSSQESPTATHVAASAGRMHEILGRMFSDQSVRIHSDHEQDSDSIVSEDTTSTFSRQGSSGQRSTLPRHSPLPHQQPQQPQQQQQQQTQGRAQATLSGQRRRSSETGGSHPSVDEDTQSVGQYDEGRDLSHRTSVGSDATVRPASSAVPSGSSKAAPSTTPERDLKGTEEPSAVVRRSLSSGTEVSPSHGLMRTSSGSLSKLTSNPPSSNSPSTSTSRGGLLKPRQSSAPSSQQQRRPLQTPLHSPSVQLGSASSGPGASGDLSRQSSTHSIGGASGGGMGAKPVLLEYIESPVSMMPSSLPPWHDQITAERQSNFLNRNASIGTMRTESSYMTARSESPTDQNDMIDHDEEAQL